MSLSEQEYRKFAAYVAARNDESHSPGPQDPFTRATYRSLFEQSAWHCNGDGIRTLAPDHEVALVDRLEIAGGPGGKEVRVLKGRAELARRTPGP